MRPPGAMCLPHTNNMDSKLQGAGTGGGASLRPRAGGVSLEPFIHQVGGNGARVRHTSVNVAIGNLHVASFFVVCAFAGGGSHQHDALR